MMETEEILADLVDQCDSKLWGKYRGEVVDNEDPQKIGCLTIKLITLFGGKYTTGWAKPCLPFGGEANQGMFFIPEKKSQIWVEFEEGDLDSPVWVGCFWSAPKGKSELPKSNGLDGKEIDDIATPITRKIIKTQKGHTIQFEDKDGEESIIVVQIVDKDKCNVISMDKSGIVLTDFTGNKIEMTKDAFTITSKVAFTIDASGKAVKIMAKSIDFKKA